MSDPLKFYFRKGLTPFLTLSFAGSDAKIGEFLNE